MEGDHDEPSAGLEQPLGGGQALGQLVELLIQVEAKRLEGPGRGMLGLVALAAEDACDNLGKLAGAS